MLQRGGDIPAGSEALGKWLNSVREKFEAAYARLDEKDRIQRFDFSDPNLEVKFEESDGPYILSQGEGSQDIKKHFGSTIRWQVLNLSSAVGEEKVKDMNSIRFSTTVEYMNDTPEYTPIMDLLRTENKLRGILREYMKSRMSTEEYANYKYKYLVEDIITLNDEKGYPLYVWTVAINFDDEKNEETELRPILELLPETVRPSTLEELVRPAE